MPILSFFSIFIASFFAWLLFAVYFQIAFPTLSRILFIVLHYSVCILAPLVTFSLLYFVYPPQLNSFNVMLAGMVSMFIIEIIVFTFLYKDDTWFFNFIDWMVPAFLIASTIYFVSVYFLGKQ